MNFKRKRVFVGLIAVSVLLVAFKGPYDRFFEISKNLDIFSTLFKEVNKVYVDEVNPTELMNVGIKSMLKTLDPYTNYIPEDRIEDYRREVDGVYGGIGAVISTRNGKVKVIMPKEGFAAHKAGLLPGDEIVEIQGKNVVGKQIDDVSKLLKGEAGDEISLKISRLGKDAPFEVKVTRENIKSKNVPYHGMVNDEVGIIQLSEFTKYASVEVKDALNDLKKQGAKNIIIDLRGNPGGLLFEAINIANIFVPKGKEIVSTKGKVNQWNRTHKALDQAADVDIPLAVLTNGNSASASEIVSGVLQDYDRAVLVGRNTFGKGLVQSTKVLTYNTQLKVTVAKYYIPSGRCIQRIDYSHRDKNGKALDVPDSLKQEFKTANGRTVYDGAGIAPDIKVDKSGWHTITRALDYYDLMFDYATIYRSKHDKVASALDFKLTKAEMDEFIKWVKQQEFEYKTALTEELKDLKKVAEKHDEYESLKASIQSLETKITAIFEKDLEANREQIKHALEAEIVGHYYLEKGMYESYFDHDKDIIAAVELFKNTEKYNTLLNKK